MNLPASIINELNAVKLRLQVDLKAFEARIKNAITETDVNLAIDLAEGHKQRIKDIDAAVSPPPDEVPATEVPATNVVPITPVVLPVVPPPVPPAPAAPTPPKAA